MLQDSSGYLDRKELDSFIRDLIRQKSGVSLWFLRPALATCPR